MYAFRLGMSTKRSWVKALDTGGRKEFTAPQAAVPPYGGARPRDSNAAVLVSHGRSPRRNR